MGGVSSLKLRGLSTEENWILNLLYELRDTVMTPPDPRLSHHGIAQTFGMGVRSVARHLKGLKERGFVLPFRVEGEKYYKITLAGIWEVQKQMTTIVEGELSTSKIGIRGVRKKVVG